MNRLLFPILICLTSVSFAQHSEHQAKPEVGGEMKSPSMQFPGDCMDMMVWDKTTASCIVLPMPGMSMGMWMIHGNGFLVQNFAEGKRGRNRLSAPHMVMTDVGHSYGRHYLNVNLMLTFEKWTFPKDGYPELLQIGEVNEDDEPYIDGQHPHSSPIMGLTIGDTIHLGGGEDYIRMFFAPRGQATEGPIAFMHRPTGMVNPDAPLGHHIGQDVSHITSTVLGSSLSVGRTQIEVSLFNGQEPEPTKVDLPIDKLNSYGVRLAYEFSHDLMAMASAAEVRDPEPHDPTLEKIWRYSGSLYSRSSLEGERLFHNTVIYGHVNNYDHVSVLRSVLDEFWLEQKSSPHQYWGRIEFVERTAAELAIENISDPEDAKWVSALTLGYTFKIKVGHDFEAGVGGSLTKDVLSSEFRDAYGGDPWSGRIFLQLSGMRMDHF